MLSDKLISTWSKGYFVEAGAHDGVGDSQTLALERAGWDGLCVEPSSAYRGLQHSRRCEVSRSILGDGNPVVFREVSGDAVELSGIVEHFQADGWDREKRPHVDRREHSVRLDTLLGIRRAPKTIEFLALDVEGAELTVLRCCVGYTFQVIQVEYNGVGSRSAELQLLLSDHRVVDDDGTNLTLVHRSLEW